MKWSFRSATLLAAAVFSTWALAAGDGSIPYPKTRRGEQVDDYHGTKVPDPYRWLEDVDAPETRAWIEAENHLTEAYLTRVPAREPVRRRLTALWNYPRYGTPVHKSGRDFFLKNEGLRNQAGVCPQASPN